MLSCKARSFDAAAYVFVAPPSIASLEERLRKRGTETEDKIQKRLSGAVGELATAGDATKVTWDGWIVNDDLEAAYEKLRALSAPAREARAQVLAARV